MRTMAATTPTAAPTAAPALDPDDEDDDEMGCVTFTLEVVVSFAIVDVDVAVAAVVAI